MEEEESLEQMDVVYIGSKGGEVGGKRGEPPPLTPSDPLWRSKTPQTGNSTRIGCKCAAAPQPCGCMEHV